jgi:hypothetical protein
MPTKRLGYGTLVQIDFTGGGSSFTNVGLTKTFKPPERKRVKVDGTALADTLKTNELGIEDHSTCEVNIFLDRTDATHALLRTTFDNNTLVKCRLVYPVGSPETFDCKISEIVPDEVDTDKFLAQKITLERLSAIS